MAPRPPLFNFLAMPLASDPVLGQEEEALLIVAPVENPGAAGRPGQIAKS